MSSLFDDTLQLIDRLLAERPERVGHDFSAATRCVAAYRDELAIIWRRTGSEADRHRLAHANAVLSVIVGGNYPLGNIPWQSIAAARTQLAQIGPAHDPCRRNRPER